MRSRWLKGVLVSPTSSLPIMRWTHVLCLVALLFTLLPAIGTLGADEVLIPQGWARGGDIASRTSLLWSTDVLFLNTGDTTARIEVLGVSNGGAGVVSPGAFFLDPDRSGSLSRALQPIVPVESAPLWILKLDVPPDVKVEGCLFIGAISESARGDIVSLNPHKFGKVALPAYRALVPARQEQHHLGTFLGSPNEIPSRMNVAIYNGGNDVAVARIEVRQHCDDNLVDERVVVLGPDTLRQFGGFQPFETECVARPGTIAGPFGSVYVIVTVDQPSLSFVTNIGNDGVPRASVAISPGL